MTRGSWQSLVNVATYSLIMHETIHTLEGFISRISDDTAAVEKKKSRSVGHALEDHDATPLGCRQE